MHKGSFRCPLERGNSSTLRGRASVRRRRSGCGGRHWPRPQRKGWQRRRAWTTRRWCGGPGHSTGPETCPPPRRWGIIYEGVTCSQVLNCGLQLFPRSGALHSKRTAVRLARGEWQGALQDSQAALDLMLPEVGGLWEERPNPLILIG